MIIKIKFLPANGIFISCDENVDKDKKYPNGAIFIFLGLFIFKLEFADLQ